MKRWRKVGRSVQKEDDTVVSLLDFHLASNISDLELKKLETQTYQCTYTPKGPK